MTRFSRDVSVIDRYLRRRRREYMEPLGLKGIHARLVMAVCRTPGCSQDHLARRMRFDKSTIARQLETLESMGFVERKPSETDKRVMCVYPTEKMLAFQPGLHKAMEEWEDALLSGLTPEEKQQLISLLAKVSGGIEVE